MYFPTGDIRKPQAVTPLSLFLFKHTFKGD